MGFLDNLGKTISEVSQTTIKKSVGAANAAKLNLMISDEERKIDKMYEAIGKKYAELHEEDFEPVYAEMMSSIRECKNRIMDYQHSIHKIKGMMTCPCCGKDIAEGGMFCPQCGASVKTEEVPTERICPECGNAS